MPKYKLEVLAWLQLEPSVMLTWAGHNYTDVALLIGRWQGERLLWTMSDVIQGDPAVSTRGLVEPTIEFLKDGPPAHDSARLQ